MASRILGERPDGITVSGVFPDTDGVNKTYGVGAVNEGFKLIRLEDHDSKPSVPEGKLEFTQMKADGGMETVLRQGGSSGTAGDLAAHVQDTDSPVMYSTPYPIF